MRQSQHPYPTIARLLCMLLPGILLLGTGCHQSAPPNAAAPTVDQPTVSKANTKLLELFQAHGVKGTPQGKWIVFPEGNRRAQATISRETEHPTGWTLELDVQFEISPEQTIVESFVGLGDTRDKAITDAFTNFAANSLHVLIAAFLKTEVKPTQHARGTTAPSQEKEVAIEPETWTIGGQKRTVVMGSVGTRGKLPARDANAFGWLQQFKEKLRAKSIAPGTHWVRLYYAQLKNESMGCEVLQDNSVWTELQSEMAAVKWPAADGFYSVRVFLVIKDG